MSSRKLKICHVITRMIVGGAQENTLFTIVGHVKNGHEVTLLTGPSPGPEGELLRNQDFPEFEIKEEPYLIRELNPLMDFKAYRSLTKFFREREFDVVHTHSSKAGVIGRAAARKAGVPLIVHTVHGQAFHRYEKWWKNKIYIASERWAAKRCDKIYAVAQAMIDQCVEAGVAPRSMYKVVYSGMDLAPFLNSTPDEELRKKLDIPADVPVIGTVARLFPLKGYEYFIPAAAEIAKKHPETRFLIVGNGIMKEQLETQIRELKLEKNFVFAGLVPPAEIYRYCSIMDALVHLSLREGLPRAVVQGLASGKPAVGFPLDGTPEVIIDGQTGYLAETANIHSVAEAVLKLLDAPEKAVEMGASGRKMVAEKFDWQRMADILEEEYYHGLNTKKY
jgi:glycosyltransferase involved in cell wall biosynthesis